ncbi:hypothetical protein C357_03390 [Citreicella sp. 357]|nr:hypothetical protein C357_03390 [Citreicella sp. 357]
MRPGLLFAVLALATQAMAEAPATSLRPPPKGDVIAQPLRPQPRPEGATPNLHQTLGQHLRGAGIPGFIPEDVVGTLSRASAFAGVSAQAVGLSRLPVLRPNSLVRRVMSQREARRKGAICGDPAIQGEPVGFVPGRIRGCGIEDAVKVHSVSGVALSQSAMLDCTTAKALKRWVNKGVKPAVGRLGGGAAGMRVAAHYACRTRNNVPGAKVSEHGRGHAIDISGVFLANGDEISVLRDWHSGPKGRALRRLHKSGCGIFGTTLGPGSDGYHEDHLHYDTARHRGGPYCR